MALRRINSFAFVIAAGVSATEARSDVIPTSGMNLSSSVRFVPGVYSLTSGLNVVAPFITVDLNGATLVGDGSGSSSGISVVGQVGVNITSSAALAGVIRGFYYGLVLVNSSGFALSNLDVSSNWVDPNSNTTWLDINAPGNLSDRVNLGGGVFISGADAGGTMANVTANHAENGFDVYHSRNVNIYNCIGSWNSGWGVHLHNSSECSIRNSVFDHNTRTGLGDSAGILLVYSSHYNVIDGNSCQWGGDGFFIGNENGCPSNFNMVTNNDCSHAGANAFECTFSTGNVFTGNRASYSGYGFWLGYSYNVTVQDNSILGNGWGVDIDHGQHNSIVGNRFRNTNGPAIQLTSDGSSNFPQPCLALPNQTVSSTTAIVGNEFIESNNFHIVLQNTTDSMVYNNYFAGNLRPGSISADALTTASTVFQAAAAPVHCCGPAAISLGAPCWRATGTLTTLGAMTPVMVWGTRTCRTTRVEPSLEVVTCCP